MEDKSYDITESANEIAWQRLLNIYRGLGFLYNFKLFCVFVCLNDDVCSITNIFTDNVNA